MILRDINVGHLCCGLGGIAKGFNRAAARVGNMVARFNCLGGVDVDPAACRDFERLAGTPATCIDLMSREQYAAFHGREPPRGWREAMPDDLRHAFGHNRHPHILTMSAPCKGFSGLLSEVLSLSPKYQALNALTLRCVWLALEAYKDDPFELLIFENVPRIATRGRALLDRITSLLRVFGYAVAETAHDCGELGGLAQSRKRFLMVARHAAKVPNFLYEPIRRPLRGVGEVLDKLPVPLPGSEIWNPMHRMPSLNWKTWVRLAFVEAGSDWRSLNKLKIEDGVLADFAIAPEAEWAASVLGVRQWQDPAATVTGRSAPGGGAHAVSDPRIEHELRAGFLGTRRWGEPTGVVAARAGPTNGAFAVCDPRVDGHAKSVQLGVRPWDKPAGVVTGKMIAGGGPHSVADPRIDGKPRFNNVYRIVRWDGVSPAVTGGGGPAGGLAVADPRTHHKPGAHESKFAVTRWNGASKTVTGSDRVGSGALCVADPRPGFGPSTHHHVLKVTPWDRPGGTVTASHHPAGGALCVADPRAGGDHQGKGKYRVTGYGEPAGTVISASTTGQGAFAVADPRPDCLQPDRAAYLSGGHYGVVAWNEASGALPGYAKNNNGRWSVADPRELALALDDGAWSLPAADARLVAVIRALDGTWHRPFTTLELAALQGLFDPDEQFELDGLSDSAKRERIGNAGPPPTFEEVGGVMGRTLLLAWSDETSGLASEPIWVRPVAAALMAAQG